MAHVRDEGVAIDQEDRCDRDAAGDVIFVAAAPREEAIIRESEAGHGRLTEHGDAGLAAGQGSKPRLAPEIIAHERQGQRGSGNALSDFAEAVGNAEEADRRAELIGQIGLLPPSAMLPLLGPYRYVQGTSPEKTILTRPTRISSPGESGV